MSKLKQQIDAGQFFVTYKLTLPKGTDLSSLLKKADSLRNHVHACNLTESHAAGMAMGPTAVAHLLFFSWFRTVQSSPIR